jgi:AhpD family alkylhydroperoxidase
MTKRLDYAAAAPEAIRSLYEAGKHLATSTLEPELRGLVTMRASQINGCAFCLALHARELAGLGVTGDRVTGLSAWREASWYGARERAGLAWTEALTRIADGHPSDELYASVKAAFTDAEMAALTLTITVINSWNRFAIGFGTPPESAEAVFKQLHALAR